MIASSFRLKTQLLTEIEASRKADILEKIEQIVLTNIKSMNLMDLTQFAHALHVRTNNISKIEYQLGIPFVSN